MTPFELFEDRLNYTNRKYLSIMFSQIDHWWFMEDYQSIDKYISYYLNDDLIKETSSVILVGILTITLHHKAHLKNRETFYIQTENFFKEYLPEKIINQKLHGLK